MATQTEFKEWYFFIPPKSQPLFKDSAILRALSRIHNSRQIDHVFLSGDYKAVEHYCEERIRATKVSSAREAAKLVLDRAFANDYRRVVCVTENRSIDGIKSDLEKHDYSVEIREF